MTAVWTICPVHEKDFPQIAAVQSAADQEPWSVGQVQEWEEFSRTDPDFPLDWFKAVDSDGHYAGWGCCGKDDWIAPEEREIWVAVLPEMRGRGAGTALLRHAEDLVSTAGVTGILGWTYGHDDCSRRWVEKRGYSLLRQRTDAALDLSTFNEAMAVEAVSRAESNGLCIRVVDQEKVRQYLDGVYRVYVETFRDVPFRSGDAPDMPYESWVHETMGSKGKKVFALAFDRDRIVGTSDLHMPRVEGQSAGINYTGVLREYRGKGLAFALKAATALAGKRAGATLIRTENDPDNPPILAVNRRLGFKSVPGNRIWRKPLV